MDALGHDDVSGDEEAVTLPHRFQGTLEEFARRGCAEV
jgi:hypothetical protein